MRINWQMHEHNELYSHSGVFVSQSRNEGQEPSLSGRKHCVKKKLTRKTTNYRLCLYELSTRDTSILAPRAVLGTGRDRE